MYSTSDCNSFNSILITVPPTIIFPFQILMSDFFKYTLMRNKQIAKTSE